MVGLRWAGADGRFNGRWDPLDHGLYRTVYAGESLLACLVELLAPRRPDRYILDDMENIVEDDENQQDYPTVSPGELDLDQWLTHRIAATGRLAARFIDITAAERVLALHPGLRPGHWPTT